MSSQVVISATLMALFAVVYRTWFVGNVPGMLAFIVATVGALLVAHRVLCGAWWPEE